MLVPALAAVAALALTATVSAAPAAAPPQGTESKPDGARREIRTPEGFLRVEEGDIVPGAGTFATYPAASSRRAGAAAAPAPPPPPPPVAEPPYPPPPPRQLDSCRAERERYLSRLLAMAGIDLEHPLDLVDALSGPPGARGDLLFSSFGLMGGVEPLRPLAWDPDLREAARRLEGCLRTSG